MGKRNKRGSKTGLGILNPAHTVSVHSLNENLHRILNHSGGNRKTICAGTVTS
jgi:hypothetical protein